MTPTATVPFTITDEAMEYIRSLGLQTELDMMIEHAKQAIPGLLRLEVRVQPPYDLGGPDAIIIGGMMLDPHSENDPTHWDWNEWMIRTFPPEVFQYFTLLLDFGETKARGSKEDRIMTPTTTVPFTITEEAVDLLRELGLQKEFEQIIDRLKQFVPGLLSIQGRVMTMYDEGNLRIVWIKCEMLDRQLEDDQTQWEWEMLYSSLYPSEVRERIGVLIYFGGPDAR